MRSARGRVMSPGGRLGWGQAKLLTNVMPSAAHPNKGNSTPQVYHVAHSVDSQHLLVPSLSSCSSSLAGECRAESLAEFGLSSACTPTAAAAASETLHARVYWGRQTWPGPYAFCAESRPERALCQQDVPHRCARPVHQLLLPTPRQNA
jgi:hypothetical protein